MLASLFLLDARAEYPDRPITMDVAFAPGGSMDMASRAMAAAAEKYLGKPIIVDNNHDIVALLTEISDALSQRGKLSWVDRALAKSKGPDRFETMANEGW